MDTPVLISHKTAWLVHHVPQNLVQSLARHDYQIGARGISTQQRVARIRQALTDCGIPSDMLKTIDISVVFEFERIRTKGVICHILGQNLPYEHIDELTPGIFITDEAFTFVLAAEWMDRIEYLEYGYEVCGDYRMGLNPADPYTEQPATTSKNEITELLDRHPGKPGATRARLELNKPLEIPQRLWHCAKARTLKIDALVTYKRRELGIEYKGGFHDEFERKGADAEREAVLSQMGYRIVTLTSAQFGSQLAFHRAMNNIREALGMPRCTDTGYQREQNELRKALIRNWKGMRDEEAPSE